MRRQKQSLFLLLTACCCLLVAFPAKAQQALFSSDVVMDVTGSDASDAKTQAMQKAQREGLEQLLSRLAPGQEKAIMAKLTDDVISGIVKSVEVEDEQIAGSRYRATLKVSYNALAIDTLLGKDMSAQAAPGADITSTSVLVIPVYEEDGKTVLWEADNPWRDAWKRAILELPGGNVLVPYGDTTDSSTMTAESIQAANFAALQPFFARYGVGEVVIVRGSFHRGSKSENSETGEPSSLSVVRREITPQKSDTFVLDYRADPQEDRDGLLLRAARDIMSQVNRQRSDLVAHQADRAGAGEDKLMVVIPTTTLDSWTKVRTALGKLQSITRMSMVAMSPQQVDASIEFRGSRLALASDITAAGMRVTQYKNYWVISRE